MKKGAVVLGLLSAALLLLELLGYFVIGCDAGPVPQLPLPQVEEVRP